jgi:hypothetical protein
MHMVAWWGEYFFFAVELGELFEQCIGIVPGGPVGIGYPARAQVAKAVDQELQVARQGAGVWRRPAKRV